MAITAVALIFPDPMDAMESEPEEPDFEGIEEISYDTWPQSN